MCCRVGWTPPGSLRRTGSEASTRCVLIDFGRLLQDTCCRAVCAYMYVCLLVHCMASAACACCQHMRQGLQHACVDVCVVRNKACAIVRTAQSGRPIRLILSGVYRTQLLSLLQQHVRTCMSPPLFHNQVVDAQTNLTAVCVCASRVCAVHCVAPWDTVTHNF